MDNNTDKELNEISEDRKQEVWHLSIFDNSYHDFNEDIMISDNVNAFKKIDND